MNKGKELRKEGGKRKGENERRLKEGKMRGKQSHTEMHILRRCSSKDEYFLSFLGLIFKIHWAYSIPKVSKA